MRIRLETAPLETPQRSPTGTRASGFDVRSPEFISQRLENLKRKPSFRQWLDQYVATQSFDDDDDDYRDGEDDLLDLSRVSATPAKQEHSTRTFGFLQSMLLSVLVLVCTPVLILVAPFLGRRSWPLGCQSVWQLLGVSYANLLSLFVGCMVLYWSLCHEIPTPLSAEAFDLHWHAVQHATRFTTDCQHCVERMAEEPDWRLFGEICATVVVQSTFLALSGLILLQTHRKWGKLALFALVLAQYLDVPLQMELKLLPAPWISGVDPTFALLDEEIQVFMEGRHLQPGGTIAWVAQDGCASFSPVSSCQKQFAGVFKADGTVAVTFESLDRFVPCYRDPPNPLKAPEFVCFNDVFLRVKSKESMPGWSMMSTSRADEDERSRGLNQQDSALLQSMGGLDAQEDRKTHNLVISVQGNARTLP